MKKMYAEERLKAERLKEAIEKSGIAVAPQGTAAKGGVEKAYFNSYGMFDF